MKNSYDLTARAILGMDEQTLWDLDKQYSNDTVLRVFYEDEGIITEETIPVIIMNWYYWRIHTRYPKTPLMSNHSIGYGNFTSSSSSKLMTQITTSIRQVYLDDPSFNLEHLAKDIYEVMNGVYNAVVIHLGDYVTTMDAKDCIEVYYHPRMQGLLKRCHEKDATSGAIQELYDGTRDLFEEEGFLPHNGLVANTKFRLAKIKQVYQFVAMRGYTTDIDSKRFKNPIESCFIRGLTKASDYIKESRSAAKALLFQKDPIKDTEYFNRRLQLINQTVQNIFIGDCGTKETIPWVVQPGDIPSLVGKYFYFDKACTDGPYVITEDKFVPHMNDIEGKEIYLRSPIQCSYKHHQGVCQVCLGQLADTIPSGTNVGHMAAYTLAEKITQSVLSTKHLDASTTIDEIDLTKEDLKYVRLGKTKKELIFFNSKLEKEARQGIVTIQVAAEEATGLPKITKGISLNNVDIFKISATKLINVVRTYNDEDDNLVILDYVNVSGPSRLSSLSLPMLEYVRKHGYTSNDARYMEINLKDWEFDQPAFVLPDKQVNMLDFMKILSEMIEAGGKSPVKRNYDPSKVEDVSGYLRKIYDYASRYISVNLMYLEVTLLATLARSEKNFDYRIPKYNNEREFISKNDAIARRSIGSAMAYEEQANSLTDTRSFSLDGKVSHPMDYLFIDTSDDAIYEDWEEKWLNKVRNSKH